MTRLTLGARAAALATVLAAGARALPAQTAVFDNATTFATQSLDQSATTGAAMAGMQVTAFFADGSSASDVWRDLGTFDQWSNPLFGAATRNDDGAGQFQRLPLQLLSQQY